MPDAILRLALPSPLRRLFDYRAPAGVLRAQLQMAEASVRQAEASAKQSRANLDYTTIKAPVAV